MASKYPTQEGLDLYIHSKRLPKCFQSGGDGGGSALLPEACPSGNKVIWTGHTTLVLPGPPRLRPDHHCRHLRRGPHCCCYRCRQNARSAPSTLFSAPSSHRVVGGGGLLVVSGVTGMRCGCSGLLCEKRSIPRGGVNPQSGSQPTAPHKPNPRSFAPNRVQVCPACGENTILPFFWRQCR